jgi:solute:Na+ symporter, SSS family
LADEAIVSAILIAGCVTIIYTFLGGLKAVAWTDFVQFFVYLGGACVALAVLVSRLDQGWQTLLEVGSAQGKFNWLDFAFDLTQPYTFWAGLFGGAFLSLSTHGADQISVQRYLAARNQREAARAVVLSGWIVLAQTGLFLLLGVGLFCFYEGRTFDRSDAIFATFIVDELPIGVKGLTLAAVFAAAMSTTSGSLNSSATVAFNDFYLRSLRTPPSERQALRVTKLLTIVFGMLQIGAALAARHLNQSVVGSVLAIAGVTTGVVLGLFFLALLPAASAAGAFAGLVVGLSVVVWLLLDDWLAWPWFALVGSLTTLTVGFTIAFWQRVAERDP